MFELAAIATLPLGFPFLFGGTFIEGIEAHPDIPAVELFPFLFGGTFIEGSQAHENSSRELMISLPFRRDFH